MIGYDTHAVRYARVNTRSIYRRLSTYDTHVGGGIWDSEKAGNQAASTQQMHHFVEEDNILHLQTRI